MFSRFPTTRYNGMTIIMSKPSRFDMDARKLLQGWAGTDFERRACRGIFLTSCYIDILENTRDKPFLPGTKIVLLLGQAALDHYCKRASQLIEIDITLNQQRGSPVVDPTSGIIYISSYLPQECFDIKASYEKNNNSYVDSGASEVVEGQDEGEGEDASDTDQKSTKGNTKRKNYWFFLQRDTQKAIGLLAGRITLQASLDTNIEIYPASDTIITELTIHKNEDFYFDIETDRVRNITCFGFSFSDGTTYVVPLLRYDYTPAYSELPHILGALAIAFRNNTAVGHNISGFDLFVLVHDYRIPIGTQVYDTMLALHRLHPEVEKSLGHGLSLYTTLPHHKNEGVFEPRNIIEERNLWLYNGKDVESLKSLKRGIDLEAIRIGAVESIQQVNESVIPYLTITLTGIKFSEERRKTLMEENDRKLNALMKIIKFLVGYELLPSSPKQCVDYFHNLMGLPVVGKTATNQPSLDEKNIYKLYVQFEHPLLPIIIYFRQIMKESGALKFNPWKELPPSEPQLTPNQQAQ